MNRVAIMQPTYLPWCGYFGLIKTVDTFVFLDTVQFSKRSWQQRNQIKTPNGPIWLTIPTINKGKRDQLIKDTFINKDEKFASKHLKSIINNYSKAKFFDSESEPIFEIINSNYELIADLNISLITLICKQLNINTKFIRSSSIKCSLKKDELLAFICQEINATEYISPPGSKNYLESSVAFERINLPIKYFEFNHPIYNQLWGEFLPNMSIVDFLFNCGKNTKDLLI